MNIYTQIGLVTLIELISKHGIHMVAFANEIQVSKIALPERPNRHSRTNKCLVRSPIVRTQKDASSASFLHKLH